MDTELKYLQPDENAVSRLCEGLACHPLLAALLSTRGIVDVNDARLFLEPGFDHLTNPFLLKDMEKAVKRVYAALQNREKILVFGDFDADGVTATAMLSDFLEYCGADVAWYIPHRTREGYSLQKPHVKRAAEQGIDLIITVDCGVTSHSAVRNAADEDIDVIITDHHEPEEELPPALAIVNPKQEDCPAGLDYLAGVGVAFYMLMALRKFFREQGVWDDRQEPNLYSHLDLFTIGTIGDMVPLIKENRALCIAGFKAMRRGRRLGLKSLAQISRVDLEKVDSDDISFKIVPRINAAGRISHARICVSQLTGTDSLQAEKTASLLDQMNVKRQKIEQQIVAEIEDRILKEPELLDDRLLFMWDKNWNPAVLGIAASKLARKYHCPVVLLSSAEELSVGSCRSINNINIHKALTACSHLLVKFGGHAMASGLTVRNSRLPELSREFKTLIKNRYSDVDFQKTMDIDAVINFDQIDFQLALEVNRLRPFGMANPEPLFICRNIQVLSSHIIGGCHRKMVLCSADAPSGNKVEAFHFNLADTQDLPLYFPELAFRLKINKFRANSPQMVIENL